MPQATFKSVYAVSSEDPANPASNLLKIQSGKKWKTQNVGEKSAYVILQLDQSQKITGIDIGNEHSAFVEVLVGKLGCTQDDFKEILITCSFMTPIESKNSSNQNRVRCFAQNALVQSVAEQKWDLIKVVCTQPFNKHVQYGLSFIKIHVADSKESVKEQKPLVPSKFIQQSNSPATKPDSTHESKHIGKFILREDSPDSDSETSSSLFNRWKQSRNSPGNRNLSTAAAIREASSPSTLKKQSESLKPMKVIKKVSQYKSEEDKSKDEIAKPVLDRNRNDLLFDDEDETPNEKLERRISADQDRIKRENDKNSKEDTKKNQTKANDSSSSKFKKFIEDNEKNTQPSTSKPKPKIRPIQNTYPTTPSQKRSISPSPSKPTSAAKKMKPEKMIEYRPFNELLKGVVLVISGIQNPDRGELRRKALELGAKYKPDWDSTCTHLICAFKNTPKYNQVKGHGKIVTKQWIEKCYALKKRLPWRRYALDDVEGEEVESEDEIHDLSLRPKSPEPEVIPEYSKTSTSKDRSFSRDKTTQDQEFEDDTLALYDLGDDKSALNRAPIHDLSSGSDTEEEIEKVRKFQMQGNEVSPNNKVQSPHKCGTPNKKQKRDEKQTPPKKVDSENIYEISTEEEDFTKSSKANWTPPRKDFFANKKFFINETLESLDRMKIKEYIKNYGGELVTVVSDADFIITKESMGVPSDFKGEMVKPLWIYECNDMEGFVPIRRYKV